MTVDITEMGHSWGCPICGKCFRRTSNRYNEESMLNARQMLQWDAINHLATHIFYNSSAPSTRE